MQEKGSRGRTMIGFETVRENEAPIIAGAFHVMPFNSNSLVSTQNQNDSTVIREKREASAPFSGNVDVSGPIVAPIDQRNFGLWFRAMFGSPTTATIVAPTTLYGGRGSTPYFDNWQRITAGSFQIKVDSGSPIEITGVDLSAVTTFDEIAEAVQVAIQAEISSVTVTWDSEFQRFIIQSGSATQIYPFTLAGSGQDVAGLMKLTSTEGAISKVATTLYRHEYRVQESQPSFSVEKGFTDIHSYHLFTGCKISSLSFTAQGDGELNATMNTLGSKETLLTAPFDSAPTPSLGLIPFNNFQAFITQDDVILANATQVNVEVDFDLDGDTYTLGSMGYRNGINEGIVKPSGNLTVFFENQDMIQAAIENRRSAIVVSFANGPHALTFKFPEVQFERTSPAIDGPRGIRLEMGFKAFYDENSDGSSMITTLINDVASY